VADLHFRLQTTEAKVTSFLQIITSMHSALFPDPAEDGKEEGQQRRPTPASTSQQTKVNEGDAEDKERGGDTDIQWYTGPTLIEEEPWPGDLSPGV
jgi:hypothetical protein